MSNDPNKMKPSRTHLDPDSSTVFLVNQQIMEFHMEEQSLCLGFKHTNHITELS
jgi:hypothetical protein